VLVDIENPLETLIFEDESGAPKTIRPTNYEKPSNTDMDKVVGEDNDSTPRPQGSHVSKDDFIELSSESEGQGPEEPYATPFPLEKKMRRAVAPPTDSDDNEAEDSEIERQLRELLRKKAKNASAKKTGAAKRSSDKVR